MFQFLEYSHPISGNPFSSLRPQLQFASRWADAVRRCKAWPAEISTRPSSSNSHRTIPPAWTSALAISHLEETGTTQVKSDWTVEIVLPDGPISPAVNVWLTDLLKEGRPLHDPLEVKANVGAGAEFESGSWAVVSSLRRALDGLTDGETLLSGRLGPGIIQMLRMATYVRRCTCPVVNPVGPETLTPPIVADLLDTVTRVLAGIAVARYTISVLTLVVEDWVRNGRKVMKGIWKELGRLVDAATGWILAPLCAYKDHVEVSSAQATRIAHATHEDPPCSTSLSPRGTGTPWAIPT